MSDSVPGTESDIVTLFCALFFHVRPEPPERHRVGADVALQVHGVEPGDVTEPRPIEPDDLAEVLRILREQRDAVARRCGVRRDAVAQYAPLTSW